MCPVLLCSNIAKYNFLSNAVLPVVSLDFSNNPAVIGSDVNVSCSAVSYPQANPHTDYVLQHPDGLTVIHTHITPGVNGIIYEINRVTDEDAGEYDCHVFVNTFSSETRAYLTVSPFTTLPGTYKCKM